MTTTHELISPDDPRCLYCNSDVDVELKGESIARSANRFDVEVLTCRKCKEKFEIHSINTVGGETVYNTFVFTCKDLCVQHVYAGKTFWIGGLKLLYESLDNTMGTEEPMVKIPAFEVEFSDKKALHKKLKTYLTFS